MDVLVAPGWFEILASSGSVDESSTGLYRSNASRQTPAVFGRHDAFRLAQGASKDDKTMRCPHCGGETLVKDPMDFYIEDEMLDGFMDRYECLDCNGDFYIFDEERDKRRVL